MLLIISSFCIILHMTWHSLHRRMEQYMSNAFAITAPANCNSQYHCMMKMKLSMWVGIIFSPPGPAHSCTVGHMSQRSIRSHCSALSSVALAKCQCQDLGLLILLLNVAALWGKRTGLICEQSAALEKQRAVWTRLCRDMSYWPHHWFPRTLWSLRMALDYISGTASLYEVFLWNSLYCLTTSTWALRPREGVEGLWWGGCLPPGVKVCGIGETWLES